MKVFAAVALLAVTPAFAQAKKTAPAAATAVDPKKKVDPKKDGKKKEEVRRGPANFKDAPKLEDVEREKLADQKRDETIESLKKIIPKIEDGSPQKAELLFQLSELYWEKSKYLNRKEMLKFQDDEKKIDDQRNKGEKVADAKEDHRESELYRSETMRLYETILREYPAYDRKDEVLFSLGYNLYETGKRDQAVKRYEELIKSYPGSKFTGDTYVQLGNHYFDVANNLTRAKEMYEKAYARPEPKIKSYALYKLAWVDFNAGEHEKALKKLQDVVDYSEKQGKLFTDLKNEALQDSVLMFVQLNRADDAMAYFKAHAGKKKAISLTQKLGFQLADAGHHDNAIKTFRYLLTDNPVGEAAPDFTQAIIKSYEGLRQRDNVKAETKKMAELYRPGSTWWKANESKKDVLRNGFNVAEEATRGIVTEYHQEAQKTKQVETYRLARDIYKQYIDAFASSDDENFVSDNAFNMKFFYAEILWALEEWEPAAQQYDQVVVFKIPSRDTAKEVSNEKYRQAASYAALLAYSNLVKIERGLMQKTTIAANAKIEEQKKKQGVEKAAQLTKRSAKELQEQPLTKYEGLLVNACDTYVKLYPNDAQEIEVKYTAAVIYYDRNQFVPAAQRFGDIILKYPEDKRSQQAADLTLSVLDEKEEWLELNKLSRQFLANKKLSKPGTEFTSRATRIVEGSQYKYVDLVVYKKDKKPKEAAEMFLEFVKEFPRSDNADRALTYSMIIFQDANELDRSIGSGERVLKEYPGSNFELKARYSLGKLYEKIADFEKSACMYEDFVAAYDDWAGPKALGYDNIKDQLKKEKDAKDKEAKANKGKKVDAKAAIAAGGCPTVGPIAAAPRKMEIKENVDAAKKEREDLLKEAEKKDDDWVSAATFNSGLWWEGLGKSDRAITDYSRYIARFKDKKDVPEIAFNIGLIHEKDKHYADAIKTYDTFLTTYQKDTRVTDARRFDVKYRIFLANRALKNNAEMDKAAKDLVTQFPKLSADEKKLDRAMLGYAHARFYQLEPVYKSYGDLKFKKMATFKKEREFKEKKLAELEKSYTEVLAVGNPEYGIASLTRIGLLYSDFAANIAEMPDPPGLDEDQLGIFRSELENRYIFPVEEKALEALEKALTKSYELNTYSEWTILAQDKLNKYKPGVYSKVRDVPYRGSEFFATGSLEKSAALTPAVPPKTTAPAAVPAAEVKPSAAANSPGAGGR